MEESDISMENEEKDQNNDKTSKNKEFSSDNKKKLQVVIRTKKRNVSDIKKGTNFFNFEFTQINFDGDKNENDKIIKEAENNDFQIINMDEKDKMFMNIYNYLNKHTDLKENEIIILNYKISFKILKLKPYYIIQIDNTIYIIDNKSREINFVDYKLKK